MTATASRNESVSASNASSGAIGTPRRALRSRIPADAAAALVFLGFALVLHLARCHPEGTWAVERSSRAAWGSAGSDMRSAEVTGTLRLDPSGVYRLETVESGAPTRVEEGRWTANFEGFELHGAPHRMGRFSASPTPLARMRADGTAELHLVGGRTLHLRRTRGD